jgi:hypothetical protein
MSVPTQSALTRTATVPSNPPTNSLIKVHWSSVEFKTYPYEKSWQPREDPTNHFIFNAFERNIYEAQLRIQPPTTKSFRALVVENEFLRLIFLPELGGRLFQITLKPTNQDLFYNNNVLKPTDWGPSNQKGWLAVGGMEWALPVNEHGYEWGVPWQTEVISHNDGTTIILSDSSSSKRIKAQIRVTLPAKGAYLVVNPHIENPTKDVARLQFWINAQISLGATKNVSPNTRFILPAESVFVHSTGNRFIPSRSIPPNDAVSPTETLSWPVVAGRDLSRYANWEDYLGVFAVNPSMPFVGAYNYDSELGLARIFDPKQVPGIKLFAFGPMFCCRPQFSDDESDYFELWGGLPRTFFADDDVVMAPSEVRDWNEYWVPFARTGGMSIASRDLILFAQTENSNAHSSVYSTVRRSGILTLLENDRELGRWAVSLVPGTPFKTNTPVHGGKIRLIFKDNNGNVLAEFDS